MSDKKVEETYKRLKREHLYYVGRNLCEILEDMRKMHEVRNYSGLLAAIEEAQLVANKLEAFREYYETEVEARERVTELLKKEAVLKVKLDNTEAKEEL